LPRKGGSLPVSGVESCAMKKALIATVLVTVFAAGCNKHTNKAKLIPISIHEVVECSAVQAVPVSIPRTSQKLCIARKAIVTEKQVRGATVGHDSSDAPEVFLYLDRDGATRMYEATQRISARHDNGRMAILIDGHLYSAPVVRGAIKDSLVINGLTTEAEAQILANALDGG
jgi:preprotein translocase subunit SecD